MPERRRRKAPLRGTTWSASKPRPSPPKSPQLFPPEAFAFPHLPPQSGEHAAMFQIGPSLREARTRRGLSPADVHKAVRIRERYLTALEEERWDMLPGDAYTKGFLRTYAEFLGLNGQLYIDEFNARIAQHDDEPLVPDALKRSGRASSILFRTIGAVLLVGALLGGLAAWRHNGAPARPTIQSAAAAPPKPAALVVHTVHRAKPAAGPEATF